MGPIRIVLEPDGSAFAYPGQVQLFAAFGRLDLPEIPEEYEQYLQWVKRLDLHFRVTMDFSGDALPGRYSDSNRPEGVPIDGFPESIPERPISNWRQIDTPHGGLVMVVGRPAALRALRTYYSDAGRDTPPGTGDNKAYGDNGVYTEDLDAVNKVTDFLGWLVIVPPGSAVVGERVEQEVNNPLRVEAIRVVREYRATATASHTAALPTASPTATATITPAKPSVTPTASPTLQPRVAYLPQVHRRTCFRRQAPVDIILAIDASSSMADATSESGPSKIAAAKSAAQAFVNLLDLDQSRVGIVAFDSASRDLTGGLTSDPVVLSSALSGLETGYGTRIDLGLVAALEILAAERLPDRLPMVVLLSDGEGDDRALGPADALRQAQIRVFTIGLGDDVDSSRLRLIATTPDDYWPSPNADDLKAIYELIGTVIVCG
jgi:Mg-chelatase subunit ChlD